MCRMGHWRALVFGRGSQRAPPVPRPPKNEKRRRNRRTPPPPRPRASHRRSESRRPCDRVIGGAARRRARGICLSGILYTCVCVCVCGCVLFVDRICHHYMCVSVCLLRRRRFQWLPPSYCVDVVKSRMQADTVGKYASMLDCAAKVETWSGVERATTP